MQNATLIIRDATGPADIGIVRKLCWDYRTYLCALGPEECKVIETLYTEDYYSALMDRLEQEHAPDKGVIMVAEIDNHIVGCGMTREIAPGVSEIKRVFVDDAARGRDAGRRICLALMDRARTDGYGVIRLDTLKSLAPARSLYQKLGFTQRGPYSDLPDIAKDLVCFYEIVL